MNSSFVNQANSFPNQCLAAHPAEITWNNPPPPGKKSPLQPLLAALACAKTRLSGSIWPIFSQGCRITWSAVSRTWRGSDRSSQAAYVLRDDISSSINEPPPIQIINCWFSLSKKTSCQDHWPKPFQPPITPQPPPERRSSGAAWSSPCNGSRRKQEVSFCSIFKDFRVLRKKKTILVLVEFFEKGWELP